MKGEFDQVCSISRRLELNNCQAERKGKSFTLYWLASHGDGEGWNNPIEFMGLLRRLHHLCQDGAGLLWSIFFVKRTSMFFLKFSSQQVESSRGELACFDAHVFLFTFKKQTDLLIIWWLALKNFRSGCVGSLFDFHPKSWLKDNLCVRTYLDGYPGDAGSFLGGNKRWRKGWKGAGYPFLPFVGEFPSLATVVVGILANGSLGIPNSLQNREGWKELLTKLLITV